MTSANLHDPASIAVDYDPFAEAPLLRVVPSTEAQREIWLAAKLEREASLAYNESSSLRLYGRLDIEALRVALQALVDRHEALHATLSPNGENLCIAEHVDLAYAVRDLSALDTASREAEIATTLRRAVDTPFDLETGPLLRAELLRLAEHDHLLVVTAHHIVCDGWSWGVLVDELATLYRGTAAESLPAAASYGDYALAQAARHDSEAYRADEAYWLGRFSGSAPTLDLPTDRPRPRRRTFASAREDYLLDADLVAALKGAGARRKASLYATLLSGFAVLLQRLTGQDDIVIGIPAAGQAAGDYLKLVGHCVNVLPLRVAVDPATPSADVLDHVRRDLLDAFEHQQYTLGTLLKRLALARDASRLPLCSVLFNLDQALDESTVDFPGLEFEFHGNPRTFENFELFINAVQVEGALRLECQYNSDLFDAATVRRWMDAYETTLRASLDHPLSAVGDLSLVSPAELEALRRLQPTPTPFESRALVSDLVFAQAARTPERSAVRCGDTRWTYADLSAQAHAMAAALEARGIGGGALVGLCLQRSAHMLAAMLGVLETGAAYVPLDPSFPRERLEFMANDAGLALLLTEASLAGTLTWPAERTMRIEEINASGTQAAPSRGRTDAEAPAYVIYTSGSTGKPKGVRVPHRAVVNFLTSMQREPGLTADDRMIAVTTLSFDIAVLELFLPLTLGAEVVLASREQAMDGNTLRDLLRASEATVMQATPATWQLLLEADWNGAPGFKALCGGESLAADLATKLVARCGSLWNMYGPTETTVWSTCCRVAHPERGISIGHPIANTTVWILDAARSPSPMGVPGEIAIGGEGVTLGYLNRPELTADRFIADPFANRPGALLYRTGDRGRWRNDGTLEHLGRLDFQVKLRGFRIELGEIESVLATHQDITRTVAITREDRPGDVRLVAYLVLRAGAALDENALRKHLRTSLPDYMVPQHFVALAAIPLLPNGKIDRRALPPPGAQAAVVARVAPRNELEQRVAAAMEETLALPGLGVYDDFFALGGHSLLAAQLTARLNREFAAALSLRSIFDAPTVAGLAEAIAATRSGDADADHVAQRSDQRIAPLSLLQKRLWLFEQINPGNLVYNTPSAHRLRGTLDERAFTRAFDEIVRRQSVLRTSIEHVGEEVVQKIHEAVSVTLFPAEDLSRLPRAERDAELARRLDELTNRPFDLTRAPLFRVHMFRLAEDEHVLFFMPHHIVWDGWSFDLFYEEFAALYRAFKEGLPSPLAPLPISYGDFAEWHGDWLKGAEYGEQFQRQLASWRTRLAARGAPPPLPADHARGGAMAGVGETEWLKVSQERTDAMRDVARRADGTLFMGLLAAYYALLYRMVGDGNLVVGTPVRVRRSTDTEKVMGLFTNLLPLPLDVEPAMTFLDLVKGVRAVVLEGFSNPEVQLEDLMREPGMREAAGAAHFYQAQFSYQDARQRDLDWGGLSHEHLPLFQRGASEDLAVWFLEHRAGMIGGVLYNADVLDPATARHIAADYLTLLDKVIANPSGTIAELTGIDAGELEAIRRLSVSAQVELPAPTVHALFEAATDAAPKARALTYGSWGTSYSELDQRANRMAACLRRRGVDAKSTVGLASGHGPNRLAAMLAILKCGAACVQLDPQRETEDLADILADAEVSVLVCDSALLARLAWPRERAFCFDLDATEWIGASNERVVSAADADALAVVVYPDSQMPRGIGLTHRGLVNLVSALRAALDVGPSRPVLGIASPDSAESLVESLLAIGTGAELIQADREESTTGKAMCSWLAEHKTGALLAAPAVWRALADAGWMNVDGSAIRAVSMGPLEPDLATDLVSRCEGLWVTFGVTEATVVSTCGPVVAGIDGQVGRPIQNSAVWVLDEMGRPCAVGASGTVHLGGVGISRSVGRRSAAEPAFTTSRNALSGDMPLIATLRRGRWRADGTLEIFLAPASVRRSSHVPSHAIADACATPDVVPLTPSQAWLIGLWKDLLGVQSLDLDDNFFDLGGHSLLAMSMVAKVEKQTRVRLNILKVANSTLRVLAAELPETAGSGAQPEAQGSIGQRVRSLFGFGRRPAGE